MLHAPDSPSFLEFYFELLLDLLLCRRAHVAIYPSEGYPWCACEAVKELQGGMARAQRQDVKNDGWAHSRPETGCEDKGCGQLLSRQKGSGRLWMGHLRAPPPKKKMQGTMTNSSHSLGNTKATSRLPLQGSMRRMLLPFFPPGIPSAWGVLKQLYTFLHLLRLLMTNLILGKTGLLWKKIMPVSWK